MDPDRPSTATAGDAVRKSPDAGDRAWDERLGTIGGLVTQTTTWLDAKRAIGQHAVRPVVCGADGAPIGGAALVVRRALRGVAVGVVAGGPVLFPLEPGHDVRAAAEEVVDGVLRGARGAGVRVLLVQPAGLDDPVDAALRRRGFVPSPVAVGPEATIQLDLARSDDELLVAMSSMRRRNIRKALRSAIELGESDDVGSFARLHQASAQRQGFTARSEAYLRAHWEALRPTGRVTILEARAEGRPVAALWLSNFAGVVTFRLPGWDASAPAPAVVNEALHWGVVQWARRQGATTYDLGGFDRAMAERLLAGDAPDDTFRQGHHAFKLGFNPVPTLLPRTLVGTTDRLTARPAAPVLARLLRSARAQQLASQWRNG